MEALLEQLNQLSHWQIDLIALLLLLQGAVLAAFPEEIVITALGILWFQGKVNFPEALFAIQIGLLPANLVMVFIGKKLGRKFLSKRPFCWLIDATAADRAALAFRKRGVLLVALTRFTPTVRGPVYFAAGTSGMSLSRFFAVDAAASFIQIPLLLLLGKSMGQNASSILAAYRMLGAAFAVLLIGTLLFSLIRRLRRARNIGPNIAN